MSLLIVTSSLFVLFLISAVIYDVTLR